MNSSQERDFRKVKIGFSRRLKCEECDRDFCTQATLRRHVYEQHARRTKLSCLYCSKTFARKHDLEKHSKKIHNESQPMMYEEEVPNIVKEDPDSISPRPDESPKTNRALVSIPKLVTESPSNITSGCCLDVSSQDAGVQTTGMAGGNGAAGGIEQRLIEQRVLERTTKELLDEDGKVVARVITERILVE